MNHCELGLEIRRHKLRHNAARAKHKTKNIACLWLSTFWVFRYCNDIYRYRYRYRSYFGHIAPKRFWFRHSALILVRYALIDVFFLKVENMRTRELHTYHTAIARRLLAPSKNSVSSHSCARYAIPINVDHTAGTTYICLPVSVVHIIPVYNQRIPARTDEMPTSHTYKYVVVVINCDIIHTWDTRARVCTISITGDHS